jgi:cytochrome c biogenesis protein CcdA/thiol-disulfide isomerase/thioredoxin
MILLVVFAFLAGVITILSPCILPILPILLANSAITGKRRPLGIVVGFVSSFTFFTLFLSSLVQWLGFGAETLRWTAIVIIGFFGLTLLISQLETLFDQAVTGLSKFAPTQPKEGFVGGVLMGISLGLVWTPCVGPILAAVISLALSGTVTGSALVITLAYALGTSLPMLGILLGGQKIWSSPQLLRRTPLIRKVFGVVMVGVALGMWLQLDRRFQTWVLTAFPNYGVGLTRIEELPLIRSALDRFQPDDSETKPGAPMNELLEDAFYRAAPDFVGGTQWLNSEPLSLDTNLKGKVVLVDFWTYTCINCIRTFPYLKKWYETYSDGEFVIVGVHAPEFEFEKKTENVIQAAKDFGLTYPIVQDNEFAIWRAYRNQYWPAHYLIDKRGKIRYTHFGEGQYVETENKIRELLGEPALQETEPAVPISRMQTPETYLGYQRAASYAPGLDIQLDQPKLYQHTPTLPPDGVSLSGSWEITPEYLNASQDHAELKLNFQAKTVYLVLEKHAESSGRVEVLLDGKPLPAISVTTPQAYTLVELPDAETRHELTLRFAAGVQAFAFTFGS